MRTELKPCELTIASARRLLDGGELSAVELASSCLKRIKQVDRSLNAVLTVCEREALAAAMAADKRIKAGERGALLGIPFLAKDNIMTKGVRTTAASKMLERYIAPYDATVIEKLKLAGAVLLGKTNLDEFAHGASTEYSAFGTTKNPWDRERVAGGSSGGSAAAVAADMCLFSLGTDTGGSVRHPASFCGVVGLKPTYGACSRFGLIAMTSSTDVPGVLAKTSDDAFAVFASIAGIDKRDATTIETRKKISKLSAVDVKKIAVGVIKEYPAGMSATAKQSFEESVNMLKQAGARIVPIVLPSAAYAVAAYYIITPSEVSSNLARFDGLRFGISAAEALSLYDEYVRTREQGFGPEVKRRIMLGTFALSAGHYDAYYVQAEKVRTKIIREFEAAFKRCDVILSPTTAGPAFKAGSKTKKPLDMYLEDYFLVPSSLAGLAAVSVPTVTSPLPLGLHIAGPRFSETKLLSIARAIERIVGPLTHKPKL